MFIEEPVPPENHDVLAEVNRSTTVPIAAGERWATIHGVRPFLEAQAVDILQCDLVNCGGITGLKKIAAMAEAHYVSMAPHNPNGPVATMINLQFAACIPNFYQLETIGSEADWQLGTSFSTAISAWRMEPFRFRAHLAIGVKLKEESLDRFPYVAQDGWR